MLDKYKCEIILKNGMIMTLEDIRACIISAMQDDFIIKSNSKMEKILLDNDASEIAYSYSDSNG